MPSLFFDFLAHFFRGHVVVHRLVANALVQVGARHLDFLLLGDAMQDEVGFQAMRGQAARHANQFLFLFLQRFVRHSALAIALHQFGRARCAFRVFKRFGGSSN